MNKLWYLLILLLLICIGVYFLVTKKKPEPPPQVLEVQSADEPLIMTTLGSEAGSQVERPFIPEDTEILTEGQDYIIQTKAMRSPRATITPRLKQTTVKKTVAPVVRKVAAVRKRSRIAVVMDESDQPKLVAPKVAPPKTPEGAPKKTHSFTSPKRSKKGVAWDVMINKPPESPATPQTMLARALQRGGKPISL